MTNDKLGHPTASTMPANFRLLIVDDNEAIHSDLKKILLHQGQPEKTTNPFGVGSHRISSNIAQSNILTCLSTGSSG